VSPASPLGVVVAVDEPVVVAVVLPVVAAVVPAVVPPVVVDGAAAVVAVDAAVVVDVDFLSLLHAAASRAPVNVNASSLVAPRVRRDVIAVPPWMPKVDELVTF
jgi:hypothetical protein